MSSRPIPTLGTNSSDDHCSIFKSKLIIDDRRRYENCRKQIVRSKRPVLCMQRRRLQCNYTMLIPLTFTTLSSIGIDNDMMIGNCHYYSMLGTN